MKNRFMLLVAFILLATTVGSNAWSAPLKIVAVENFYGDIAKQVGGDHIRVKSILNDPNQDPHLFEASPSVARELADSDVVIFSGADYDPWAGKLLSASPSSHRTVIDVATLTGHKTGDNPHIWYDPQTMITLARSLANRFQSRDPVHKADYAGNLQRFMNAMQPLKERITLLHQRFKSVPVTATEPVFGYMAKAIGLSMRNRAFQWAMMNDTDPSASDVAAFERDIQEHKVATLIYNNQVTDAMTDRLKALAEKAGIPIVGVSETQPPTQAHYQDWMLAQLHSLESALAEFR